MKKITTTIDKEYEYFGHIFSKEELAEWFSILEKDDLVKKDIKTGEYEINGLKLLKIANEYNRKVKYGK